MTMFPAYNSLTVSKHSICTVFEDIKSLLFALKHYTVQELFNIQSYESASKILPSLLNQDAMENIKQLCGLMLFNNKTEHDTYIFIIDINPVLNMIKQKTILNMIKQKYNSLIIIYLNNNAESVINNDDKYLNERLLCIAMITRINCDKLLIYVYIKIIILCVLVLVVVQIMDNIYNNNMNNILNDNNDIKNKPSDN
eukprot:477150_1